MDATRLLSVFLVVLTINSVYTAPRNPASNTNNGNAGNNNANSNAQPPPQNHQQQQVHQQTQTDVPVDAGTLISDHPACQADVKRLCHGNADDPKNEKEEKKIQHNFEVLECFMSYEGDDKPPSDACQTVVYKYRQTLTTDSRFETAAREVCKDFIQKHNVVKECSFSSTVKGAFLPCLMEVGSFIEDENAIGKNCADFLGRMQQVIFSDYHLVYQFQEACKADINRFNCGLLFDHAQKQTSGENEETSSLKQHNQGSVINCLETKHLDQLAPQCKHQIMRVAELQADDYHLDRPLYFACRVDREKFCGAVKSGDGKVYHCLMEKQKSGDLDPKCLEQLEKRERLMQEDVKVDRGFYSACKEVLESTQCISAKQSANELVGMSHVLACLMDAEAEGGDNVKIPEECEKEMQLFQENLMNDYKMSPGIISKCHAEIEGPCKGMKKSHTKDGTVHCLMALAMPTNHLEDGKAESAISNECKAELTGLVNEARPASVIAIDGFLLDQCGSLLDKYCPKSKEPLDCLMDQIRSGHIDQTSDCARHLLELEYFISRNYKHDMRLVNACQKDIKEYNLDHHLRREEKGPESDGLVFIQLYHLIRKQLSGETIKHAIDKKCVAEVLRSVRERAVSIDLNPELEEACMHELTTLCKGAEHGKEQACLEENVEKIKASSHPEMPGCRELLERNIVDMDKDYQLDTILMKACEPTIEKHCKTVLENIEDDSFDEGAIFECLLEHKFDDDMDPKCFAGIEHHQLINMKDFNFHGQFREHCKKDFDRQCRHAKSKAEAVYCLSAVIRNDTLLEHDQRVSKGCRHQLRAELLALEDTIQMDPDFEKHCGKDVKQHCGHVTPKPGAADPADLFLTCMKAVDPEELRKPCAKYIFKIAKLGKAIIGVSSRILRQCTSEIKKWCKSYIGDPETFLRCIDEKYEASSRGCRTALDQENAENNQDIRLNPALYTACKKDVDEFCSVEMNKAHVDDDDSRHGAVINCLKMEYLKGVKSGLSESCSNQMHLLVVRVQARYYKQDYVLTHHCKDQLINCAKYGYKDDQKILECLKKKLFDGELQSSIECQVEVFRLITENRVDIQTDPELHEACLNDLQDSECKSVIAGSGRVMSCLLSLYDAGTLKNHLCKEMVKKRKELWVYAAKLSPPEALRIWYDDNISPSWHIVAIIAAVGLAILGMFVIVVCCCRAGKFRQNRCESENIDKHHPEKVPLLLGDDMARHL